MESNHPELKFNIFECLDISAILRFKLAQSGLMYLNYTELVHMRHFYLAPPQRFIREYSVKLNQSNYPDHKFKNIACLAISAIMRFKMIRRGLMHLNYSEIVHKSHAYLEAPSKIYLEEIR